MLSLDLVSESHLRELIMPLSPSSAVLLEYPRNQKLLLGIAYLHLSLLEADAFIFESEEDFKKNFNKLDNKMVAKDKDSAYIFFTISKDEIDL